MLKTNFNVDHDLEYKKFDKLKKSFLDKDSILKFNGFFIHGKSGVGKTTFVKHLVKNIKKRNDVINVQEWISLHQKAWNSEGYSGIYVPSAERLASQTVLFVDDIGSEYMHPSTIPYLYKLFDLRNEYKKQHPNIVTIVTSNFNIEELEKKYLRSSDEKISERLISRIKGLLTVEINFDGTDKRYEKQSKVVNLNEIEF